MEENHEIDLREYLLVVRRRFWVLVLVVLAALTSSGVLSYVLLPKIYAASTTLMVLKHQSPVMDYSTVRQLVKTYGEIARSRQVSERVIRELGLQMTVNEFQKRISVRLVQDTELLEISVEDCDPVLAASMANTLVRVFMDHVGALMQVDNVVVIDPAIEPLRPVRPRPLLNLAIAGILGVMTGVPLIFLIENLENTIKTADDVQRYLALPLLGAIPVIDARLVGKSPHVGASERGR